MTMRRASINYKPLRGRPATPNADLETYKNWIAQIAEELSQRATDIDGIIREIRRLQKVDSNINGDIPF